MQTTKETLTKADVVNKLSWVSKPRSWVENGGRSGEEHGRISSAASRPRAHHPVLSTRSGEINEVAGRAQHCLANQPAGPDAAIKWPRPAETGTINFTVVAGTS
jgi:hypothetical protein